MARRLTSSEGSGQCVLLSVSAPPTNPAHTHRQCQTHTDPMHVYKTHKARTHSHLRRSKFSTVIIAPSFCGRERVRKDWCRSLEGVQRCVQYTLPLSFSKRLNQTTTGSELTVSVGVEDGEREHMRADPLRRQRRPKLLIKSRPKRGMNALREEIRHS